MSDPRFSRQIKLNADGTKQEPEIELKIPAGVIPIGTVSTQETRTKVLMDGLIGKTINLTKALLTGTVITPERVQSRIQICATCDKVRRSGEGTSKALMWCGICGCALKGDKSLINLARYEETPEYGCKHPAGSRWKAQDV